jgi:hypothetical protein
MTKLKTYRVRIEETVVYEISVATDDVDGIDEAAMDMLTAMSHEERFEAVVAGGGTGAIDIIEEVVA